MLGVTNKIKKWLIIIIVAVVIVMSISLLLWLLFHDDKARAPTTPIQVANLNDPQVQLDLFTGGLTSPTAIVATTNKADKRLFVLEQAGLIRIIDSDGKLQNQLFLDISHNVLNNGEMGLLGLAFHPNYATNGFFYINYVNKSQETIIARYEASPNINQADDNSEKVLIRLTQPYTNHNGGDLKFGPDGFLYVALGDGGSAGDPENRSQSKNTLFGKILRVDIDNGDPYAIPPSNPFVGQTTTRSEIWAYGLRNPWRISFDKATGDLYIADVGQGDNEEVNIQPAASKGGVNYGWRCYEGNSPFNTQGCLSVGNYKAPVFEYNHDEGRCSITGGSVYRGNKYPALAGMYFYGDFCNGQLFYAEKKDNEWQQTLALKTTHRFSTFGQDSNDELYVADYATGSIYKVTDSTN